MNFREDDKSLCRKGQYDAPMARFLTRRIAALFPSLLGVALLGFLMVHLVPGDPARAYLGERATPQALAALRARLGLDHPLAVQAWGYAGRLVRGDFGTSLRTLQPVSEELGRVVPATIELAAVALLLAVLLGIPLGVAAALKPGSGMDLGISAVSVLGLALPVFWLGLMLTWALGVHGPGLPFDGRLAPEREIPMKTGLMLADTLLAGDGEAFRDALARLVLPALTLAFVPAAMLCRMTRSQMREAMAEPYVLAARARGLSPARVVWAHAFPNALVPVLTSAGLQAGALLGGAALTETVFSWPGIGRYLVEAVRNRDFPALQGALVAAALAFLLVNLLVDLAYAAADPRIRRPA